MFLLHTREKTCPAHAWLCWQVYTMSSSLPLPSLFLSAKCDVAAGASSLQTSVAQKRLLEDLMGGGPVLNSSTVPAFRSTSSSTSIGFGNSCSSSTAFGGASTFSPGFGVNALQPSNSCWPQPLAAVKKQKTGLAEQSSNAGASSQLASSTGKDAVVVQAGALPQSVKVDSDTATANNSALPAFLQPSSVNATYGKNTADTFNKD